MLTSIINGLLSNGLIYPIFSHLSSCFFWKVMLVAEDEETVAQKV